MKFNCSSPFNHSSSSFFDLHESSYPSNWPNDAEISPTDKLGITPASRDRYNKIFEDLCVAQENNRSELLEFRDFFSSFIIQEVSIENIMGLNTDGSNEQMLMNFLVFGIEKIYQQIYPGEKTIESDLPDESGLETFFIANSLTGGKFQENWNLFAELVKKGPKNMGKPHPRNHVVELTNPVIMEFDRVFDALIKQHLEKKETLLEIKRKWMLYAKTVKGVTSRYLSPDQRGQIFLAKIRGFGRGQEKSLTEIAKQMNRSTASANSFWQREVEKGDAEALLVALGDAIGRVYLKRPKTSKSKKTKCSPNVGEVVGVSSGKKRGREDVDSTASSPINVDSPASPPSKKGRRCVNLDPQITYGDDAN